MAFNGYFRSFRIRLRLVWVDLVLLTNVNYQARRVARVKRGRAKRCHIRIGSARRFSIFVGWRITCFYIAITSTFKRFTFAMGAFDTTRHVDVFFCYIRCILCFYRATKCINKCNFAWLFWTRFRVIRVKSSFSRLFKCVDRRNLRFAGLRSYRVKEFQYGYFRYL